jgi:DNA-binding transcriptional ArsR family regulator
MREGCMEAETRNLRYAKALSHPTRIRILMAMNAPRRTMSPKDFSEEAACSLPNSSYHFRKLQRLGFIRLVRTEQRRGATEHYYEPVKRALAWTEESRALPPAMLDGFAATILRGFVEEAGAAIDSGAFNDRPDRALAWDKMWVDEEGWEELTALFSRTLAEAMKIEEGCAERRERGVSGFFASYALAAFESPPPPSHD